MRNGPPGRGAACLHVVCCHCERRPAQHRLQRRLHVAVALVWAQVLEVQQLAELCELRFGARQQLVEAAPRAAERLPRQLVVGRLLQPLQAQLLGQRVAAGARRSRLRACAAARGCCAPLFVASLLVRSLLGLLRSAASARGRGGTAHVYACRLLFLLFLLRQRGDGRLGRLHRQWDLVLIVVCARACEREGRQPSFSLAYPKTSHPPYRRRGSKLAGE